VIISIKKIKICNAKFKNLSKKDNSLISKLTFSQKFLLILNFARNMSKNFKLFGAFL